MTENKEILINNQTEKVNKPVEMVDLQKDRETIVPREVRSWMEKVEEDPSLKNQSQQIKGDDDSILQPIATGVTKVVLPTNKSTFSTGFGKSVGDAGRWLSEFVFRLIKKNKGNVKFNEE
jgi:hypothetical protein